MLSVMTPVGGPAILPCFCLFPFGLVGVALMALWIWAIVEVATKEPAEDKDKVMWILIVVLAGWIGALIYLLVRRPERIKKYGQ